MSWHPSSRWLHAGRTLHLQQGPIDLLIRCEGEPDAVQQGYASAQSAFAEVLPALVAELPILRTSAHQTEERCSGAVAQRMQDAVEPFSACDVTPMAAVAGAVADYILQVICSASAPTRAWVNNGGDIAVHLSAGQCFDCGIVDSLQLAQSIGQFRLEAAQGIAGIATSGQAMSTQGGRSFSLGIADAVTVLADCAAAADVAATLIANQVDLPGHRAISRVPANALDPDSDLRDRAVTTAVGELDQDEILQALQRGCSQAEHFLQQGQIHSALLSLRGQYRMVQSKAMLSEIAC